jgi:hypothetical protein
MSEKIYSLLLRLYPRGFSQRFHDEALQLMRERLREEQGFLPKLQLWLELLFDTVSSLPLAYRNTYAIGEAAAIAPHSPGLPEFRMLEGRPLSPVSIFMGSIFATASLALFVVLMSHVTGFHASSRFMQRLQAATSGTQPNPDVQAIAERLQQQSDAAGRQRACSFEKFELHPGNIGYVKLSWFADPASCAPVAEAVMARLSETDAVIFDLRDTRGGYPEMVRLMAGWLFDHPVSWYNPRATSPAQQVTQTPADGAGLTRQPIFVLTSSRTFSGAEHFAYNLQSLKRAVIIGERTSGASHAGPRGAPGPIAASEPTPVWEGTGVLPDIQVNSDDALRTAENLALRSLQKK